MKCYELFAKYDWDAVKHKLYYQYPDQKKNIQGYKEAFFELKEAATYIENDSLIAIEYIKEDDEGYHDVYSLKPDDETRYALDFVDWREVLGMSIEPTTLEEYYELDIIAHLLFEITFYGYSNEKVVAKGEELYSIVDEVKRDYGVLM
jgi:hypothetical protein